MILRTWSMRGMKPFSIRIKHQTFHPAASGSSPQILVTWLADTLKNQILEVFCCLSKDSVPLGNHKVRICFSPCTAYTSCTLKPQLPALSSYHDLHADTFTDIRNFQLSYGRIGCRHPGRRRLKAHLHFFRPNCSSQSSPPFLPLWLKKMNESWVWL